MWCRIGPRDDFLRGARSGYSGRGRTSRNSRLRARRFIAERSHNSVWLGGIEVMSPWSADLDLNQFEHRRRNAC
jgi:hypothetical protein